jgi:hypothetical protein
LRDNDVVTDPSEEEAPKEGLPVAPPVEETNDTAFDALWQRVLDCWDDDKPHGAVLEYALRTEQLPLIAGRYRALATDPVKGERAKKRLDAIVVAATQLMMSMKTPPQTKVPLPLTLSAVGIFLFALGFLVYAMMHR